MTRKEFLALANAQYDKLTDLQSKEDFAKIWTELEGQVMHASLKKGTSADKQKNDCHVYASIDGSMIQMDQAARNKGIQRQETELLEGTTQNDIKIS